MPVVSRVNSGDQTGNLTVSGLEVDRIDAQELSLQAIYKEWFVFICLFVCFYDYRHVIS